MLRKILASALIVSIFTIASSVSVFAQTGASEENQSNKQVIAEPGKEVQTEKVKTSSNDESRNAFLKSDATSNLNTNEKENLSSYEKSKAKGKGLSKGAKIAIIAGIAVGVVVAVAFAASRDKIRTF
jgi:hypothetical protein